MALYWDWKAIKGTVEVKCTNNNWKKINIYRGNALCILIDEDLPDNQYQLISFFCDKEHFKNMMKHDKEYFDNFKNWNIETTEKDLIKLLVQYDIPISTYKIEKIKQETDRSPI